MWGGGGLLPLQPLRGPLAYPNTAPWCLVCVRTHFSTLVLCSLLFSLSLVVYLNKVSCYNYLIFPDHVSVLDLFSFSPCIFSSFDFYLVILFFLLFVCLLLLLNSLHVSSLISSVLLTSPLKGHREVGVRRVYCAFLSANDWSLPI